MAPRSLDAIARVHERRSIVRFSIALVLATVALGPLGHAYAQPAERLVGHPIRGIETTPETPPGVTLDTLGIAGGTPFGRGALRAATLHLLGSGEWAEVRIDGRADGNDVVLIVALVPRVLLTRIELVGNEHLSDEELLEALGLREGSEVIGGQLDEILERLKDVYDERGYLAATFDATLRSTDAAARRVLRVVVHEGEPTRVTRIDVEGDALPRSDDPLSPVLGTLGLGVGDALDRRRLPTGAAALEQRLRQDGYLEAHVGEVHPEIEQNGARLIVPLHLGRHYRIVIHGFEPVARSAVEDVLHLDRERLVRAGLPDIEARVLDVFRRRGFASAQASVRRVRDPELPDDPHAAVLDVSIVPGPLLRVVGLSFPGASHYESDFLRDQVRSYLEEDLPSSAPFSPVDSDVVDRIGLSGRSEIEARSVPAHHEDVPDSVYYEPTYVEAVTHIQELYQADGFLDAEVGPAVLEELGDGRAIVRIPITEGPRTQVWDVGIRGNELLNASVLLDAARIARGDPFGHLPLEEARRRMVELYQERGFYFARIEPRVHFSPDHRRAEILFEVVERFPVTVGEISVVGAHQTSESVIRDRLTFHTGDLFRPSDLRRSEEALAALGIFSTVRILPDDPDLAERTKPVVVTVSERTAQELGLSGGIGTGEGARGSFEYAYRNLFGTAITLNLRLMLAYQFFFQDAQLQQAITSLQLIDRLERRLTIGFSIPHIPGVPQLRGSIDLVDLRDNFRNFGLDKDGVVLTLTWQPEHAFVGSLSGELERNNISLFGNQQSLNAFLATPTGMMQQRLLRAPQGESAIASVRVTGTLDLRDSPFTPTRGFYGSVTAEYGHTLVTEHPQDYSHFIKVSLTMSGYVPLATGWTIALQVRGGRVYHLEQNSRVYPNRAYYLGGVDTMRGFLQDQVIPQDQADVLQRSLNVDAANALTPGGGAQSLDPASIVRTGDFFYLIRTELRFPISGDVQGGIFADIGNVWAVWDTVDLLRLRYTAGAGIRLATPVGPIALDYGFNLSRNVVIGEPFGAFHFSIGLF
jgi:outer membrane protein assembly complex protein YaeT